jgi:hypothetical protein
MASARKKKLLTAFRSHVCGRACSYVRVACGCVCARARARAWFVGVYAATCERHSLGEQNGVPPKSNGQVAQYFGCLLLREGPGRGVDVLRHDAHAGKAAHGKHDEQRLRPCTNESRECRRPLAGAVAQHARARLVRQVP